MKTLLLIFAVSFGLLSNVNAADYNAIKNDGKNIEAWMQKISKFDKSTPNDEIVRTAYVPSDSGVSPYESMKSSAAFFDESAKSFAAGESAEDKANANSATEMALKLKRLAATLDLAKARDASSLDKSLSTSAAYGRLLELKTKSNFNRAEFDALTIATAKKAQSKNSPKTSAPVSKKGQGFQ